MKEPQLMRRLKKQGWRYLIRWSKGWRGYCEPEQKRISINVMKIIASVIVHENYHAEDNSRTEEEVSDYERIRRFAMTQEEANAIVQEFNPELFIAIAMLTNRRLG